MTWRKAGRAALIVAVTVLPTLILRANLRRQAPSAFDRTVLRLTMPLQDGVTALGGWLSAAWYRYVSLGDAELENRELRREVSRLHDELTRLRERTFDTARLEEMLAFQPAEVASRIGARVVASTLDHRMAVVRIALDRGNQDLKVGMPVLSAHGLVGRIQRVVDDYADVMLLSDAASSVDVLLERTNQRGLLRGDGRAAAGTGRLHWVEAQAGVGPEVGDRVVTSGLGGLFPPGLPVGEVMAVNQRPYAMFADIEVRFYAKLTALRTVSVIQPNTVNEHVRESMRAGPLVPRPL